MDTTPPNVTHSGTKASIEEEVPERALRVALGAYH
jgi:hypothetical protein